MAARVALSCAPAEQNRRLPTWRDPRASAAARAKEPVEDSAEAPSRATELRASRMSEFEWRLTPESGQAILETLGKNLYRERERAGIPQEHLAGLSGFSRNTIARMEAGKQEPRIATMLAISWALYVPIEALLADLPVPPTLDRVGRQALERRPWLEK